MMLTHMLEVYWTTVHPVTAREWFERVFALDFLRQQRGIPSIFD